MSPVKRPPTAKRSETVTVRLDPKLRYLAEIAARKHRRTLSSYIEWAIEDSLKYVQLDGCDTMADEAETLWDVDDADRFAQLALRHADLLTHEEQVRWKHIRENGWLWRGRYTSGEWTWSVGSKSLLFDRLRERWADFVAAAETGDTSKLPTWPKEQPEKEKRQAPNFADMDDDVPF